MHIIKGLRFILAAIFFGSGILHFVNLEFYLKIMPEYLPIPWALVFISGGLEILAGLGLLVSEHRKTASYLIIVLLILFFPVHIDHVLNGGHISDKISISTAGAWGRLLFQVVFIVWAWRVGKS